MANEPVDNPDNLDNLDNSAGVGKIMEGDKTVSDIASGVLSIWIIFAVYWRLV